MTVEQPTLINPITQGTMRGWIICRQPFVLEVERPESEINY